MKKYQAGGIAHKTTKSPMVDPQGAFTKVQQRTIASTKKAKTGTCISCGKKKTKKK